MLTKNYSIKTFLTLTILMIGFFTTKGQDVNSGLIGYWPFDDGSVDDVTGNGHNASFNSAVNVTGKWGDADGAYSFNGVDQYIEISNGVSDFVPTIETAPISISVWIKMDGTIDNGSTVFCISSSTDNYKYLWLNIGHHTQNLIKEVVTLQRGLNSTTASHQGGIQQNGSGDPDVWDGGWHHLVFISTGSAYQIYIDNVSYSPYFNLGSDDGEWGGSSFNTLDKIQIGSLRGNGAWFAGAIDDLRYYDRALSIADVNALYNMTQANVIEAPGNFTAIAMSSYQVDIQWEVVSGATNYILERSEDNLNFAQIAEIDPNETAYTDFELDESQTYYYRMRSTNGVLFSVWSTSNISTPEASSYWQPGINSLYYTLGNVGIGVVNPSDAKLEVDGTILAEELKVKDVNGGADFVFEEDYQLMSLIDLQAFINEHHHLPEVPSAASMTKEGLSVAEFNILLLQKIEELTLHLIQKEEELDDLKSRFELLEKRIDK
ncbi:MAG: hypothetical protein JXQ90_21095 [Cyclobacteriaceae bacterium]